MKYVTTINECAFTIDINRSGEIIVDGVRHAVDMKTLDGMLHSLLIDHNSYEAIVERHQDQYHVLMHGSLYVVHVADEREQHLGRSSFVPPSGELPITAPMPGLIVDVAVEKGQEVEIGDNLVILESMKMGNEIKAPREGVVHRVAVKAGDSVEQHQVLVVIS